jgi:hypothetical protein
MGYYHSLCLEASGVLNRWASPADSIHNDEDQVPGNVRGFGEFVSFTGMRSKAWCGTVWRYSQHFAIPAQGEDNESDTRNNASSILQSTSVSFWDMAQRISKR